MTRRSLLMALACLACLRAEDFAAQRAKALALGELTAAPAVHAAEGYDSTAGLKAIFFDGPPWKGKPTRVFAWLGLPERKDGAKVSGVVLVHGGGGTAFREWVEKWTARGYAAIAIATEGQTDQAEETAKGRAWKRQPWGGPARDKIFADSGEPLEDQWIYQAVAQTVLANSLLRSLPEVDAEKVGVMGISWGGVVTSTVIGIDPRFAFAIPTYGCGHLFDAANQWALRSATTRRIAKSGTRWSAWPA
ncbi:MAG: acetylxylan esterase [Bryobacterales bacterium]